MIFSSISGGLEVEGVHDVSTVRMEELSMTVPLRMSLIVY